MRLRKNRPAEKITAPVALREICIAISSTRRLIHNRTYQIDRDCEYSIRLRARLRLVEHTFSLIEVLLATI